MPSKGNGCQLLIILFVLSPVLLFGGCMLMVLFAPKDSTPAAPHVAIGNQGVLDNGDAQILVAADHPAFDQLVKYSTTNDLTGIAQLAQAGEAFYVDGGTRVLKTDSGFTGWAEIRILSGEHAGQQAFTSEEWVKP